MYHFSHIVEYFKNAPSLQHVFGFSYYISNLAMIEKNKVKFWTSSPPRVAFNYWITLSKYLLCKITCLSTFTTFPTNHTPVIKFFPLKTARREETDNVGKHSGSRRIPHRGAHMWSVKSKYLPLISEKDSCQDKLTSFLNNMDVTGLIPCITCKET